MAVKEPRKTTDEPYKCEDCGAMVFVSSRLHGVLCYTYKSSPDLVSGSHAYYKQAMIDKAKELASQPSPKRGKKKLEKNHDLLTEQFARGGDGPSGEV